ncbi:MAG: hypothetical protein R3B97_12585 [Dehalococcoidia bacterium]
MKPLSIAQQIQLLSAAGRWLATVERISDNYLWTVNLRPGFDATSEGARIAAESHETTEDDRRRRYASLTRDERLALYARDSVGPDDLHLLGVALGHLARIAELLEPTVDTATALLLRRFRDAWYPIRQLRNFLEHEEDYIAGVGRNRTLIGPRALQATIGYSRWTAGTRRQGLRTVEVLGHEFDVSESVGLARELTKPFAQLLTTLVQSGGTNSV